jgi:hypothetical protein
MCASILVLSYLKMKEILYAAVTLVITIAANAQKKKPVAPAMLDVSQLGGTKPCGYAFGIEVRDKASIINGFGGGEAELKGGAAAWFGGK